MKKILSLIIILPMFCKAQDSTVVTISLQNRDVEYFGSFMFFDPEFESLTDSIKVKYRVANPPSGNNTPVTISCYTKDWIVLVKKLNNTPMAIIFGTRDRLNVLLRAVNQPYLTGKLDELDAYNTDAAQSARQFGRNKWRRQ